MIDLCKELDSEIVLTESSVGKGRIKHIFEDGELTFAEIRDILTKVFSGDLKMTEKVDGIPMLITYKNGDFYWCSDVRDVKNPVKLHKFCNTCSKNISKDGKLAVSNTLDDIENALMQLDGILLNKYFANG